MQLQEDYEKRIQDLERRVQALYPCKDGEASVYQIRTSTSHYRNEKIRRYLPPIR